MRNPIAALCLFALILPSGLNAQTQSGPTPYPDAKNSAQWPGKGPIRWFGWMTENRNAFWKQRQADQGKIVFAGDSIIGGWKLEKDFPGKPLANRGIGGDVTRGLLFRLQEDILDLKPKAIVLEIGSNDITADASIADVVSNYDTILETIAKASPGTPVVVMTMTPHGIPEGAKAPSEALKTYLLKVNARLPEANKELAKLPSRHKNVVFADTYTPMLLPDGSQDASLFTADTVHPNDAGRAKLAAVVSKALTDLKLF